MSASSHCPFCSAVYPLSLLLLFPAVYPSPAAAYPLIFAQPVFSSRFLPQPCAPPPAAMESLPSGRDAFDDFVSFMEGMDSQLEGLSALAEPGPSTGTHVASPVSPESPAEAPPIAGPKTPEARPIAGPKTPEEPPNPGTPPWRRPQRAIAPPVSAGHAHPSAIDWNDPAVIEIEKKITFEYGKKFKERGPPAPDKGGPTTWRGQVFRQQGHRWGNRGGKYKEEWKQLFAQGGGKGGKKGKKGDSKGGGKQGCSSEGGGSSSRWSHGQGR